MEERYVRRDVRTPARADVWDEASLAYARAIGVMQARPLEDPTSWTAQAALHVCCPRGTWFFLPWARMQLWYLERILRAIVVDGGGQRDWGLPFWSYGDGPASAALPGAFAAPALPDGSPNPLYRPDGERAACLNAGRPLPDAVTSAARALAARTFSPGLGGDPGIPGEAAETAPPGLLEAQPHETVTAVLGPEAPLDPVFPLHLANVDRLWEVWLAHGEGRANPAHFDWADRAFCFHDADGRLRSLTCGQVGDLANLDYGYAGLPAPARDERVLTPDADCAPIVGCRGWRGQIAGGEGIELGPEPRRLALRPAAEGPLAAGDARVYLSVEDAEGGGVPGGVWEVRVGDGAAAVGTIALGSTAGGRRFLFDVTDAIAGAGEPMVVSFHPALPPGFLVEPAPTARVGRVALMRA
jgi:tyrosinase-like protein/polyphenol oxidase-like protein